MFRYLYQHILFKIKYSKANERIDQYKLNMNCNEEELERWALAAKQKEEDNLALEKYMRQDEVKIKEHNLEIEKLTVHFFIKFMEKD